MKGISVVLPAYKEAENLKVLLPRLQAALSNLGCTYEILVIDTVAPMDTTQEICKEYAEVVYVNRQPRNVCGDAVRTGIHTAQGKYLVIMDADGSHSPEFIPELFHHKGKDTIVIASRYKQGTTTDVNVGLTIMSRLLNITYAVILNMPYKDMSNSFRLYDRSLFSHCKLRADNFDIYEEILFRLKDRAKIIELPYAFKKRIKGTSKRNLIVFICSFLFTLLKLRLSTFLHTSMVRYLAAAVAGLLVDLAIFSTLTYQLAVHYLLAGLAGFCAGFLANFVVGRTVVFAKTARPSFRREIATVLFVSIAGLGIHELVLYLSVDGVRLHSFVGKLLAVAVTFFWNYWGRRRFVYVPQQNSVTTQGAARAKNQQ